MVDARLEKISGLFINVYKAFSELHLKHEATMDEETSLKLKAAEDLAQSMDYDHLRNLLLALYNRTKNNLESSK